MSTLDTTKPNLSQTMGDVIDTTRENFEAADTDIDALDAALTAHAASQAAAAHGIDDLVSGKADYVTHKANVADAHGIDDILTDVAANSDEIEDARGSTDSLAERLFTALGLDGTLKVTSLQSKYLEPGDTPTYVSSKVFTVPGDRTLIYKAGFLVRATCGGEYVYGIIGSSAYTSLTTVTLTDDYPVLSSPTTKVDVALMHYSNAVEAAAATNASDIVDLQSQITALTVQGVESFANGIHSPAATTRWVLCDATIALVEIVLPTAATNTGRVLTIKRLDSSGFNCQLNPVAAEQIEGAAMYQLSSMESVTVVCDGTEWWIMGDFS